MALFEEIVPSLFGATMAEKGKKKVQREALNVKQRGLEPYDFSYNSGERQTATTLEGVRPDHIDRYTWAIEQIRAGLGDGPLTGGDYFCGDGYGTRLLSDLGPVTGVDGSHDAIAAAKAHFANDNTSFRQALFPFALEPGSHDYIVSLESVAHVPDAAALLAAWAEALRPGGMLVISTPNEDVYPFDPTRAPHHFRHFRPAEIRVLTEGVGLEEVAAIGQRPVGRSKREYTLVPMEKRRFRIFAFRKKG